MAAVLQGQDRCPENAARNVEEAPHDPSATQGVEFLHPLFDDIDVHFGFRFAEATAAGEGIALTFAENRDAAPPETGWIRPMPTSEVDCRCPSKFNRVSLRLCTTK